MTLLTAADLPAAVMNTPETVLEDPHAHATGFLRVEEHPSEGPVVSIGIPQTRRATPASVRYPAPRPGEHTADLLAEAGFGDDEIAKLLKSGAFRAAAEGDGMNG
jgi:crotonobetainyl-CoA:carnitine CoA-transferase CaiB-like acyl-CoA transferase